MPCLLLFKGKYLSSVFSIKPSSISYHHALCRFDPMLKRFLKKQSFLSRFMSTDARHLIAYLSIGLFLSTSTLYLGRRPRNTQCLGTYRHQWQVTLCLVRGFHYWLLVKRFYKCSTKKILITLPRLYCASWRPSPLSVAFLTSVNSLHY